MGEGVGGVGATCLSSNPENLPGKPKSNLFYFYCLDVRRVGKSPPGKCNEMC